MGADAHAMGGEIGIPGVLEYDESRMAKIHSRLAGRVEKVFVDFEGSQVKKGEALVELSAPELYAVHHELLQARKAAENSQLLEAARERLGLLGMSALQIEQLEQQNEPTGRCTIHAPIAGIVIDKKVQAGQRVEDGTHLLTIADPTRLHATLYVRMSEIRHLRLGQPITLTVEGSRDRVFPGEIVLIDPVVHPVTGQVKVVAEVANEQGELKPGMHIQATLRNG